MTNHRAVIVEPAINRELSVDHDGSMYTNLYTDLALQSASLWTTIDGSAASLDRHSRASASGSGGLMSGILTFVQRTVAAASREPAQPNMPSLRDQAYVMLKNAIAETDIYDGSQELRLDERDLTAALGVSRTPLREALSLLEREGFIRIMPRRGIYIVRKSKREIIELIQMWAALESMAARLATLRATDAEIAALRHLFEQFQHTPPSQHLDEYSDANIAFHTAVIALGGSRIIVNETRDLLMHVCAIRRATISQRDRADRSIVDHLKIIEALECRNTELAERLSREHTLDLARHVERYCDF
jgi:DNA-binding GntR family transcriptional regulator